MTALTAATVLRDDARWAPYLYVNMPDSVETDPEMLSRMKGAIITTADLFASTCSIRACRFGGDFYMPMLVGQPTTPLVYEVIMGYRLLQDSDPNKAREYLSCLYTTCDYFLGCNALNTTWITGLGLRHPRRIFHMDSWYNGKTDMAPGITPYGPWRVESWATGQGAWDLKWPYSSINPVDIHEWPGHERWFNNYTCPMNAEFTIHQNTVLNAATFGFLCADVSAGFVPNRRPDIRFTSPDAEKVQTDTLYLAVSATDPDGDSTIYKVEYYNNRHKIGESYKAPYDFNWHNTAGSLLKLTARAIDQYGLIGRTDTLTINSIVNADQVRSGSVISCAAYPNPFSTAVQIEYALKSSSFVSIEICDLSGKKVGSLQKGYQKAGSHSVKWDGTDVNRYPVGPGAYLCHWEVREILQSRSESTKILLLKNR